MKIYVDYTNTNSLSENGYFKLVNEFKEITWTNNLTNSYDANIIIVRPSYCSNEILDKYSNLKHIQLITAGFDNIDFNYLKERKISLSNASDVFSIAIAEDIISKILYINKNMKSYENNRFNKIWETKDVFHELFGSTIGIIGLGSIGLETAKRLKGFNTKILGYKKRYETFKDIDEVYIDEEGLNYILSVSDYIVLAVPLNIDTYHLINAKTIALMKPSAVLINVARGEVVNQNDLIEALKANQIRAAALDVVTPEPLNEESPLWTLDNVFLSPHSSNLSPYTEERLVNRLILNLKEKIRG